MKIAPAQYNSFCQSIPEPIRSVLFYAESESDITPKLSRFIEQGLNRKISDYQTINAADLLKKEIFLSDLLSNQSLFGPPQPIIIQKASDKLVPLLEEHLSIQGREDIIIVISEAYLKPNSKLRQFYEKEDSLACIACYARTVSEIAQDIQTAFKASGQLIDRAALQLLVDIVAQGKTTTKMEVNKIINYLGDNKEQVTLDDVKACTSMDMDVSIEKIYTAVLKKNWAAFPNLILNLEQESRNEIGVVRGLISKLLQVQGLKSLLAEGKNFEQACRIINPPVFFQEKNMIQEALRLWQTHELNRTIKKLVFLEKEIKLEANTGSHMLAMAFLKNLPIK